MIESKLFIQTCIICEIILLGKSFSPNFIYSQQSVHVKKLNNQRTTNKYHGCLYQQPNEIIDVEVIPDNEDEKKKQKKSSNNAGTSEFKPRGTKQLSLLQASLASVEPKLSSLSFNFVDPAPKTASKQSFIPCRVAFTAKYNDVEYVLGTPTDTQVGIYVEDTNTNEAYFLDPDEDENMEIMERVASVFQSKYEHISLSDLDENDDVSKVTGGQKKLSIRFKRTPRALTVEGDLSMVTGNWKQDTNKQLEEVKDVVKELFQDSNDDTTISDDDYFHNFFTKELGSNYREEALANTALDEQANEVMDLFNVPGLGTQKDDSEGIKELFDEILSDQDEKMPNEEVSGLSETETALRLVGFSDESDNGKVYSLVQLLQPMILVAKNHESLEFDERLLLTAEEAQEIVPVLEQQFKEQFQEAGIHLAA